MPDKPRFKALITRAHSAICGKARDSTLWTCLESLLQIKQLSFALPLAVVECAAQVVQQIRRQHGIFMKCFERDIRSQTVQVYGRGYVHL